MQLYEYEDVPSIFAHPKLVECKGCDLIFVDKFIYDESPDKTFEMKKGYCKHCKESKS